MRRITKVKRSVRAISPVIATLLMIAIAVVAALVAYAWVIGYMGSTTSKAGQAIQIQSITTDQANQLVVYVQNVGQGEVVLDSGYVNNDQVAQTLNMRLSQGDTGTVITTYQVTSDAALSIKIVTTEGIFAMFTGSPLTGDTTANQVVFTLGAGGHSINPSGTKLYASGTPIVVSTVADSGYQFSYWSSVGSISFDSPISATTIARINGQGSITANFIATQPSQNYPVSWTLGQGGSSMSPTGTQTYAGGSAVSIYAIPASGYQFSNWISSTTSGSITFDSVTSATTTAHINGAGTVTANFNQIQTGQTYQVTFTTNGGGTSSTTNPSGTQTYNAGQIVPIRATAGSGYQFSSWSTTGSISFDSSTSISTNARIDGDGSIIANFIVSQPAQNYQVTFSLGTGGASMNPSGTQNYAGGSAVPISAVAASDYQFYSWIGTGSISFDSATSISTTAHINSAGSITANFVAIATGQNYQVTFTLGDGGTSMTPTGTQTYLSGSTIPLTATPASGNKFSSWTSTGTISFDNANLALTNAHIGSDGTVTANFAAIPPPTKLAFIAGTSQVLGTRQVSSIITVQLQDANGNPVTATQAVSVTLTKRSTGSLYSNPQGTTAVTSPVTIPIGSDSVSFWYSDSSTGSAAITASSVPLASDATTLTINNYGTRSAVNIASSFTPTNNIEPGDQIQDTVVLVGTNINSATGTVTYYLYRGIWQSGTQTLIDSQTVTVTGGSVPNSKQFTVPQQEGSYYFLTQYGGDSTHQPATATLPEEFVAWPSTRTILLFPTADTGDHDLENHGASANFECVNDPAPDGDATYVDNTYTGYYTDDVYIFEDPTHTGTVAFITINAVGRTTGTGSIQMALTVYDRNNGQYYEYDGSTAQGLGFPLTTSYREYTTVWNINPHTNAAWTWQQIDDLRFGPSLNSGTAGMARCTQVYIQVYYNP
jgi:flagellin-like protein